MKSKINELSDEAKNTWNAKQTYIALSNLLNAAAELKIDVTPMEGFVPAQYNEILGLDPKHDKVTLTIHAETLRRLMAIDRPVIECNSLLRSIIANLNLIEKGVTKYQTSIILQHLDNNNDLT